MFNTEPNKFQKVDSCVLVGRVKKNGIGEKGWGKKKRREEDERYVTS
jgi:hypothetical protein